MPEQSNDYRVVVFGAGGVGKSSLVLRFVKGTFRDTYIPTVEDTYQQNDSVDMKCETTIHVESVGKKRGDNISYSSDLVLKSWTSPSEMLLFVSPQVD